MSETIREQVLGAFAAKADGEAHAASRRREDAAEEGVVRGPYAKEGRWRTAMDALAAVPSERWQALSDWLGHFSVTPDAPPIRHRPRDRKAHWTGAEQEAVERVVNGLRAALQRVETALGPDGLDTEQQSGRDMEGRLGRAFYEVPYTLERVREDLEVAIDLLLDPQSTYDDDPDIDEPPPFDLAQRHPATRAFPELMRFWTEDVGQPSNKKTFFKTFALTALSAAAKAAGDSPAEWTAGLDEAFKQR